MSSNLVLEARVMERDYFSTEYEALTEEEERLHQHAFSYEECIEKASNIVNFTNSPSMVCFKNCFGGEITLVVLTKTTSVYRYCQIIFLVLRS